MRSLPPRSVSESERCPYGSDCTEAGSERLRRVLKKGYKEEEILEAVNTLVENGLFQIKSYFMIGLPSETDEDMKAIVHWPSGFAIRWFRTPKRKNANGSWFSVLILLSKACTPFQWTALDSVDELKRKLKTIHRELKGEKQISMIHDLPKWAYVQHCSQGRSQSRKMLLEAHRSQEIGRWPFGNRASIQILRPSEERSG